MSRNDTLHLLLPCLIFVAPLLSGAGQPHDEPPVEGLTRVVDAKSHAELSLDQLVAELAKADVAFLGESHDDETTHRLQLELYRRLIEAREGRVVLAMEMFSRDAQPALDAYLAGETDEATFLAESNPWQNYRVAYRPLVELAKTRGLPVVGSNSARSVQRKIGFGGEEAFRELEDSERQLVASEMHPPTDSYWRRVENATRGHRGMLPAEGARAYTTQSIWDNTMGESIVRALKDHEGRLVLHVNGGFHSQWHDGTARQVALRAPDATIRTVAITPVRTPAAIDPTRQPPDADWHAYVARRATDARLGYYAVPLSNELRYRLFVPKGATVDAPVPLLIWLPDDGPPTADELALWKQRLGEEAAIAVVQQQWREQQEDLSLGGRWTWPADFREDIGRAGSAVEQIWAYVLRYQPVDPERVVIAGEGVGACVAVTAHLYGDRWTGEAIAIAPRKHDGLRDLPLPLPEARVGDAPARSLTVLSPTAQAEWWTQETADYREVGLTASVEAWPEDPWRRLATVEDGIREALGLAPAAARGEGRAHVVLEHDTPLARSWARRVATAHAASSTDSVAILSRAEAEAHSESLAASSELPTRASAELFTGQAKLPRATGHFGGTTLVVLGDELSDAEVEAWRQLEKDDPLNASSRFHRLRTATLAGERSVDVVLAELKSQRRTNVLIVPASFAAGPATMRALRDASRAHEDDMTLDFRPGLGSALASSSTAEQGDG